MGEAGAVVLVLGICALAGAAGGVAGVFLAAVLIKGELRGRLDTLKAEWKPGAAE